MEPVRPRRSILWGRSRGEGGGDEGELNECEFVRLEWRREYLWVRMRVDGDGDGVGDGVEVGVGDSALGKRWCEDGGKGMA